MWIPTLLASEIAVPVQEEEAADDSAAGVKEEAQEDADTDAGPSSAAVKDEDSEEAAGAEDEGTFAGMLHHAGAWQSPYFGPYGRPSCSCRVVVSVYVRAQSLTDSIATSQSSGVLPKLADAQAQPECRLAAMGAFAPAGVSGVLLPTR